LAKISSQNSIVKLFYKIENFLKKDAHNSFAILQNQIDSVSCWLYMATENQEIANFLFYKTK